MRRLVSITLLLMFSLPLISPLLALGTDSESRLPACCQMHGKHHCTMSAEAMGVLLSGEHFAAAPSKCPRFPKAVSPVPHPILAFLRPALIIANVLSFPAVRGRTEAWARVELEGTRYTRGPPMTFLL